MKSREQARADSLRKRAADLLQKSPESYLSADLKDVRELAQELAIHQAELELQNEELQDTQIALQETRDRFVSLFEQAPVGYVVLDSSGIIRQANTTFHAMINQPELDLRGKPFTSTMLEEDVPVFLARFRAFFTDPAEKQIIVRLHRQGNLPFHARIEAKLRLPGPGMEDGTEKQRRELMVTISDVADLEEAREKIEQQNLELLHANERERRLAAILGTIRNVNQMITHEEAREQLIYSACKTLTADLSYYSAWITLLDEQLQHAVLIAQSGFNSGFHSLQQNLLEGNFPVCMQRALKNDKVIVFTDPDRVCAGCPIADEYNHHSSLIFRLEFQGRVYGVLAVSVPPHFADNKEEQGLFVEVANDLAFALNKIERTERAHQNHERLRFVIDGARQGTWEWNIQTNETIFNQPWADMLGYTLEELTPYSFDTWVQLTHPDDFQKAKEKLNRCMKGETPDYGCVVRMKHKNGDWVWILDRGRVMTYDADGKPLLMFGTHTDISEHRKVEEQLGQTSESLQAILDHSPLLICELTHDGRYAMINRANAEFYKQDPSDLVGKPFDDLLPKETAALFMERIRSVLEARQPVTVEDQIGTGETARHYLTTLYPLFDTAGEIRSIGSIAHEITERIRSEQYVQQNAARLAAIVDILQYRSEDLQDFLDHALQKALELTSSSIGYIYFYDEDRREFILNSWSDQVFHECSIINPQTCYELDKTGIWGEAVRQRRTIVLNDFEAEHPLKKGYPEGHAHLHRFLTVPIFHQDRIVAVIGVANKPTDYDESNELQLTLLMDSVWKTVENMRATTILQEREQFLRTILETTVDGFWVINQEGRILEVNDAYCRMSGYPREEILELGIVNLDAVESPQSTQDRIQRIITDGAEIFETYHRRKDGSLWPVEVSATWMDLEGGRFVCFCRDLTERIQRDERIALLGRMLDDAPAAITIHRTDGGFMYANHQNLQLHGYDTEEEFMALNLHELDVPESEALLEERFRRIAEEGNARFEAEHYRKDGSIFPLEVTAKLIQLEDQPAILSIATDITERKEAELALRTSEEKFRSYVENSPVGIYVADNAGQFTAVNDAACRDTGYSQEELLQMNLTELIPPDDIATSLNLFKSVHEKKRLFAEIPFIRKDGMLRYWSLNAILLPDLQVMSFAADITDQKNLEEQFLQAQKMETVGRLAGGVAHDFNNMLSVILGHLEMAMDELDPSHAIFKDLREAYRSAERSADLTRQLLAFARKQTISPEVLDLNHTVGGMLTMLERLIGEDIDLLWQPGADPGPVLIDPTQINQMLANLCVNARDAIQGNGKITIETSNIEFDEDYCARHQGFSPGRYSLLAVSDDGCGMDSEIMNHLFEPFYTTKGIGQGTGLGLATVYGIVRQNNGFIHAYSEPGQGTTFRIYLPHAELKPAAQKPSRPAAASTGTETILLVEDEPAILQVTTMMLERMGYTVLPAPSPLESLQIALSHSGKIDLLITDVIMPEMNGRELAEKLHEQRPGLKKLFMSGYTANAIAHHGVLDPDVEFIQKPFSSSGLAEKIRAVLLKE